MRLKNRGMPEVAEIVVKRSLALNHDHEAIWMTWLLIVCGIEVPTSMAEELSKSRNAHMQAMLVQASVERKLKRKPKLGLGGQLSSTNSKWLVNLVARSQGFSKAAFSGLYSAEFEHLAKKSIKLLDFSDHTKTIEKQNRRAISRTRYGYDDNEIDEFDDLHGLIDEEG